MTRKATFTIRYDPEVDAATLVVDPRQTVVRHSVMVRPPGLRAAAGVDPADHSVDLRLKFDQDGGCTASSS